MNTTAIKRGITREEMKRNLKVKRKEAKEKNTLITQTMIAAAVIGPAWCLVWGLMIYIAKLTS